MCEHASECMCVNMCVYVNVHVCNVCVCMCVCRDKLTCILLVDILVFTLTSSPEIHFLVTMIFYSVPDTNRWMDRKTDGQTLDKVIPMCLPYALQVMQNHSSKFHAISINDYIFDFCRLDGGGSAGSLFTLPVKD